ncbi:hypothetical protein FD00_GL002436 [Liquorilactobacillus mali KCTC 3596 = DSM 20444]|uniref:Uncharacterized protein n=1 Tax=Liquorilactobacillus mali KCTC 3596 = DSM 20444 TaxID=1046596 RepID=A0A0R2E252_9LACO|nr:hypothetical protein FD00_GL002436 [Liquorilactobacillus mali KCTC 3596 = DSM 20444]
MNSDEQSPLESLRASIIPSDVSVPGVKLTNLSSILLGQRVMKFAWNRSNSMLPSSCFETFFLAA